MCAVAGSVVVLLMLTAVTATAADEPAIAVPFPVGERLSYGVSWMGIHCGRMDILSFSEAQEDGKPVYRIVVFARTTKFFDGIYRVRTRLDSHFDPIRMTSVRYEEDSLEKKRHKHEVWLFDPTTGTVSRTKDGEIITIPGGVKRAYDPLAFIFRLREVATKDGSESVLALMTSKGAVETVARVTETRTIRTKMGRSPAMAVVPDPRDRMLFSKSGAMVVWVEKAEPRRPCRIEFDLSFGKLVANLTHVEQVDGPDALLEWAGWTEREERD